MSPGRSMSTRIGAACFRSRWRICAVIRAYARWRGYCVEPVEAPGRCRPKADGHRNGGRQRIPMRHLGLITPIGVIAGPDPLPAAVVGRDQTPAGVVIAVVTVTHSEEERVAVVVVMMVTSVPGIALPHAGRAGAKRRHVSWAIKPRVDAEP